MLVPFFFLFFFSFFLANRYDCVMTFFANSCDCVMTLRKAKIATKWHQIYFNVFDIFNINSIL